MKLYIASDFHIGYEESNYPAIMAFLDIVEKDADEFIMLGDVLDLWRNDYKTIIAQEPYKSAYEKLIKTSKVVPTTIVRGNHDYNIKKHMKESTITIKDRFVRDGVCFMHGWEIDIVQLPFEPILEKIIDYFPMIYKKFIYKSRDKRMYELNGDDLVLAAARKLIAKKKYKALIFGHTHAPLIEGNVYNCGDMVNNTSYITVEDGKLSLMYLPI